MFVNSDIYTVRSFAKNEIESDLREFVASADFPCVGAKAALRRHQLEILVVPDIPALWFGQTDHDMSARFCRSA